jgi:ParB family chromosome partitioning protein
MAPVAEEHTIVPQKILKLKEIHANANFNCRGEIAPIDVVDLMRDIQAVGRLIQPVCVRVYSEAEQKIFHMKYSLVAGFRRYLACKLLNWEELPCLVDEHMTETEARLINLKENLKRKDLNILQEAKSIEQFHYLNYNETSIAHDLGMSLGWVQVRRRLLQMAPEIQAVAAAGLLTQTQINQIYAMPIAKRIEAVKAIKLSKERGEKKTTLITQKLSDNKNTKRARSRREIMVLQATIYNTVGPNLLTRMLGWSTGEVADGEFYEELAKHLQDEYGATMLLPNHLKKHN